MLAVLVLLLVVVICCVSKYFRITAATLLMEITDLVT